jgi:hypothetical protein
MDVCDKSKLRAFSFSHLTYINQIFGDISVREVISEMYTQRKWEFLVEDAGIDFENSKHHMLQKKTTNGKTQKWCSVEEGIQDMSVNVNDNLCQSYTILKYLNKKIDEDPKKRQMQMISTYRKILKKTYFKKEMSAILDIMRTSNTNEFATKWIDYTTKKNTFLDKDLDSLYCEIKNVLDEWERYGYMYFIGNGDCLSL